MTSVMGSTTSLVSLGPVGSTSDIAICGCCESKTSVHSCELVLFGVGVLLSFVLTVGIWVVELVRAC